MELNDRYKVSELGYDKASGGENPPGALFYNLKWLTTKEAAVYLRRSVNAVHLLVSRGQLKARKFCNRLYFKRDELDYVIETSKFVGG